MGVAVKFGQGSKKTRDFYESKGWQSSESGRLVDTEMFGVHEDGPIRQYLHAQRYERIKAAFGNQPQNFVEMGCGGNPTLELKEIWGRYTGIDFSEQGLAQSRAVLMDQGVPFELVHADITDVPLNDNIADAVFCAHVIYHIDSVSGQRAALREAARILKPGGVAIFVLANPYPILFPIRLTKRLVAGIPGVAALSKKVGREAPLPYLPLRPGWVKSQLDGFGDVQVSVYSMHSTWFNQKVTEFSGLGKILWKTLAWIETRWPRIAMYLGNYAVVSLRKAGG